MPKVNLNRDAPLNDAAKQIYQYLQAQTGVQKLIKMMGYGQTTHCKRKKHPEDLTLEQLRIIYKEAHLTDAEFMRMVRAESDRNESRF